MGHKCHGLAKCCFSNQSLIKRLGCYSSNTGMLRNNAAYKPVFPLLRLFALQNVVICNSVTLQQCS